MVFEGGEDKMIELCKKNKESFNGLKSMDGTYVNNKNKIEMGTTLTKSYRET